MENLCEMVLEQKLVLAELKVIPVRLYVSLFLSVPVSLSLSLCLFCLSLPFGLFLYFTRVLPGVQILQLTFLKLPQLTRAARGRQAGC